MTHPYLDVPHPIAFAHRGAAESCCENAAEAIQCAVDLGYDYVETDVQATSDGVAVLFHDDTTDRLLGRPGCIRELSWAELSRMDLVGGGRVARLDQVLADHPNLRLNIDAKTDDVVRPMGDAIKGSLDRVLAASFKFHRTKQLLDRFGQRLCWSPSLGGAARVWLRGWRVPAGGAQVPCVQVSTKFKGIPVVTTRFLRAAHATGTKVHVWTVDDPQEMTDLLDLGVDGLMTDCPRELRQVMQERGAWPTLRRAVNPEGPGPH
ncbi:glycerophosphodiester phosphodiesterase family protein [Palleronia abyssalis]|uniref:Glycerophosphodiester phosphodiesterase, cytoplasmic n=1 Tax=Palleronia abyssalis TaxID=1501240 RepID=A0A2R8BQ20_9RHOB|nr:glycerophosphodiester phosphodiesterase family protein [Palleronia abyssalis]SPJ22241.1 Glycerophosphodiester phosphodiesterase, cytoplasmic [Palleronia abyssalis]